MDRGRLVWVVGPDGAGKTAVCHALVASPPPGLRLETAQRVTLPRRTQGVVTEPHRHEPYPRALSVLKALYYSADALLTWGLRVRPALRRGVWVIQERGWWDMLVDPRRYRLQPHPRLLRWLAQVLPRADVVLVLEGNPAVIWGRKPELSKTEIARQVEAWRTQLPAGQRRAYLNAALPLQEVVRTASSALEHMVKALP